ncbi:MAG: hypothetical protein IKB98_03800, partial [Clostridia bacterium]|nr:hypothetical protein [Clostridia bacterium]
MNKVYVDKARLLRRVIIISWISLALCFVIKIFGGNFFEIMCERENYKALCEYADTHLWLKFVIGFISSMLCQSLFLLAIWEQYKYTKSQFIVTFISIFVLCFVKLYNTLIGSILDIWAFFGLPLIFINKSWKNFLSILIGIVLIFAFQVLSLIAKNIGLVNVGETYFIGLIYMIDLYLMCLLYYLYRNYRKEQKEMGILWVMFAGKPADKLKAMKEKREA